MKKALILILAVLLTAPSLLAQDQESLSRKEQRKLLRDQRKQENAQMEAERADLVEHMLNNQIFVLEANMLYDRYGQSTQVQSTLNFILVDTVQCVLQIGNPYYIGLNGVGGITITGKAVNYEVKKNQKKNTYSVRFTLQSALGTYDVSMYVSSTGNADAWVTGSFSGKIRYSGRLEHPAASRVYQGTAY
jgi:hypothetical protein